MLRFVKRGADHPQPLGQLPPWLSALLRGRGVDTEEKAERFLHPELSQLYDPFLMQDMEKAVEIIRRAASEQWSVVVYGDYDVDGMCATSIMLETLQDLGVQAEFRIPTRHGEGYGLNCDAVRELAACNQLMITVDCGITNHEEVRLARQLGMTVIVTDHHQPSAEPSPADAVLNPLLGQYPFRRLCGAGVALKLTQALLGMEAVLKRVDLAALATVADIVPLIDENRVIVAEGLRRLENTPRPGLRALMQLANVHPPVQTGHVGFRLAPRLNAGGRLEDASQGVLLLTSTEVAEAETIAAHLEQSNQQRQAVEQEMIQQALGMMAESVDFRDDLVIVVMGEGWNSGVIGLAAGRICEKYHFPTIVLSRQGELAVGSCRSIPGVNIHAMLSTCKDLFLRFGGHEQAAGLTMRAELVPELRRRLNLAIRANCDLRCYIPTREYDLPLRLENVTLELIDALSALEPTGYGNPSPVFLTRGASLQQAYRVGKTRTHLKLTLLEGSALRDGIAFGQGDVAEQGLENVDVLFSPERNEFRGQVSAQLQVSAIQGAEGTMTAPPPLTFFCGLLQEIEALAANTTKFVPQPLPTVTLAGLRGLLKTGRGVLLLALGAESAAQVLAEYSLDQAVGRVMDERGFNTVLMAPRCADLTDVWTDVVLLDGDVLPGFAERVQEMCPRAALHAMKPEPALVALLDSLAMEDEPLRNLYRRLRRGGSTAASDLSADTGLSLPQVLVGLTAFRQVQLARFTTDPYAVSLLPPVKCRMDDSAVIRYLRARSRA